MTSNFAQLHNLAILISGIVLPLILVVLISSRRSSKPVMVALNKR